MKWLLLILLAPLILAGCQMPHSTPIYSAATPNEPVLIADFGEPYPPAKIHAALLASLRDRGWTLVSTTETGAKARLIHRGFESNILVEVSRTGFTVYSDSWRIDREGNRLNPEHPDGWLRNIEHDVRRSVGAMFP